MNVMKRIFLSAAMSVPVVIMFPRTLSAQHFSKPIDYPVGPMPSALAAGDFNRDGNVDLVVTIENGVRLLLGNGKGEFQPAVDLGVGQSSTSIALGDFNEDHTLDLVIATDTSATIALGNGDGTVKPAVSFDAGISPQQVQVADFNSDGHADLLLSNSKGELSVLLGKGDGTFLPPIVTATDGTTALVAIGDFDGDGRLDVITGNGHFTHSELAGGDLILLLGRGDATFESPKISTQPVWFHAFSTADVDGDGKLDLAVLATGGVFDISVRVLWGNRDGTFELSPRIKGIFSKAVVAADINGDGALDLVSLESIDPQSLPMEIQTMSAKGNRSFQDIGFNPCDPSGGCIQLSKFPSSFLVADLNGDRLPDYVVANLHDSSISVFLNQAGLGARELVVITAGSGQGTVTSAPNGINCGATCTADFPLGTTVTLTAASDPTSGFNGWSGPCSGTGVCAITLDKDQSVIATFGLSASDFSISTGPPTPDPVQPGQSSVAAVTVTSVKEFNAAVVFECSVSPVLAHGPECSAPSVTPSADGLATVSLRISTTAESSVLPAFHEKNRMHSASPALRILLALGLAAWLGASRRGPRGRRIVAALLPVGALFICGTGLANCGSSGHQKSANSTPVGTYAITVTGTSGSLQHSASLRLTVK